MAVAHRSRALLSTLILASWDALLPESMMEFSDGERAIGMPGKSGSASGVDRKHAVRKSSFAARAGVCAGARAAMRAGGWHASDRKGRASAVFGRRVQFGRTLGARVETATLGDSDASARGERHSSGAGQADRRLDLNESSAADLTDIACGLAAQLGDRRRQLRQLRQRSLRLTPGAHRDTSLLRMRIIGSRKPRRHQALCDSCNTYICGARFKCTNCVDFDYCGTCFAAVIVGERTVEDLPAQQGAQADEQAAARLQAVPATTTSHDRTHVFVKISIPLGMGDQQPRIDLGTPYGAVGGSGAGADASASAGHEGFLCDGCDFPIGLGVRFKCIHCENYDLCAQCEERGLHVETHVLAVIVQPRPDLGRWRPAPASYFHAPSAPSAGASASIEGGDTLAAAATLDGETEHEAVLCDLCFPLVEQLPLAAAGDASRFCESKCSSERSVECKSSECECDCVIASDSDSASASASASTSSSEHTALTWSTGLTAGNGTNIVGTRWRCACCTDFDLCTACLQSASAREHVARHPFWRLSHEVRRRRMRTWHAHSESSLFGGGKASAGRGGSGGGGPMLLCFGCSADLLGCVHYKCGSCAMFVLCATCVEQEGCAGHDRTHALLRVERPLARAWYAPDAPLLLRRPLYEARRFTVRRREVTGTSLASAPAPELSEAERGPYRVRAVGGLGEAARLGLVDVQCFRSAWSVGEFRRTLSRQGALALCASNASDTMGGYILAMQTSLQTGSILSLAVLPRLRRHGIGRMLLDAALHMLRARGVQTTTLHVSCVNQSAMRLYESFGFTYAGRVYDYYTSEVNPLQESADAFTMQLRW